MSTLNMSIIDEACKIEKPLTWTKENRSLFVQACREMAIFHSGHSPELNYLYKKYGFNPESIMSEEDLESIVPVGVTAMKYYLLTSLPHDKAVLKLTSSGTTGQKTQIWFDRESLDRVQGMLTSLWEEEGLVSASPANYLFFVYDPKDAEDLGITFSINNQQRFAPPLKSYYAIKKDQNGAWKFDHEGTLSQLEDFAREGKPVRLSGIPSFMYELLDIMEKRGEKVVLPPGSLVMTGGGWKAREDKKVSREVFRAKITNCLGIPDELIRDGYGLAEHSSPYIDCKDHRFHVPAYNHIIIRDPITMKPLPKGEAGLLELITPFNAMLPNLAILSTDIGYLDPDLCSCGHNSPTFTLTGRGGLTKHKGCAIAAGDIVRRN